MKRKLDDSLALWLDEFNLQLAAFNATGAPLSATRARQGLATITQSLVTDIPYIAMVNDAAIEHVPIRVYHPQPLQPLPILMYLHGGGHVAGSIAVYDPICRKLALASQHIVVAIDYRLAPEYPYPAAVNDGYLCLQQLLPQLDRMGVHYSPQVSIGGDSAGGALAATLCGLAQQDNRISIHKQVLIYPSLDYTLSLPSTVINGRNYFLQTDKIEWYFKQYFADQDERYKASPLWQAVGEHFPATLVITTEFCPLRDDGRYYYQKLCQQGVSAQYYNMPNMVHAFLNLENVVPTYCQQAYERIKTFLAIDEA